jgi:hypothetical protein
MASGGKKRSGGGNFPPNPTQWPAERNGLAFRSRYGLNPQVALCPFERRLANVRVIATRNELAEFVDSRLIDHLLGSARNRWSGMTIPCDGEFIIVMNPTHARTRQNATLMEEFFHILLKHKPSRVGTCPATGIIRREFDPAMESEAYHSAAAALVPYSALKAMVSDGLKIRDIAEHFEVSNDLTVFRLKTCKLYRRAS